MFFYSRIYWRGLYRCWKRGSHLMVFGHGLPERWFYCWDCFYKFRWDKPSLAKRFRNYLGTFIKEA